MRAGKLDDICADRPVYFQWIATSAGIKIGNLLCYTLDSLKIPTVLIRLLEAFCLGSFHYSV